MEFRRWSSAGRPWPGGLKSPSRLKRCLCRRREREKCVSRSCTRVCAIQTPIRWVDRILRAVSRSFSATKAAGSSKASARASTASSQGITFCPSMSRNAEHANFAFLRKLIFVRKFELLRYWFIYYYFYILIYKQIQIFYKKNYLETFI